MSFTTILSAAGIGLQVFGQLRQSQQQAQIYDYNAAISQQKVELAKRAGDVRISQLKREQRRFASKQTAAYAAAGVRMTGSPLQVISDTAAEIELDILIEDYNTRLDILNAQSDAELNSIRSRISSQAGYINAGSTLLTQIPNFVSSMNRGKV